MTQATIDFWKPYPLASDETLSWEIGEALLRARHTAHEWQIARQDIGAANDAITWKRFTTGTEEQILEPLPRMPDLSVIVRPEEPIHLAPEHSAVFYVSIPLWIQLTAGKDRSLILCDEPLVNLSKLWFGEPTDGELCYSLKTRARRDDNQTDEAHRAVCKVTMRNASGTMVDFERLCLPAKHLNVYRSPHALRGDDVTVIYGKDAINQVRIHGRPAEATDDPPLGTAREKAPSGKILQRGFGMLRSFLH